MIDGIPVTGNIVYVESFLFPDSDLTKKKLRRLACKRPEHGGQWDTIVQIFVTEDFPQPQGVGPLLGCPFADHGEGELTEKFEEFVTKKEYLLDEVRRERCLSKMVKKMVTPESGSQEYLIKRMAREAAELAEEATLKGHKVLHIQVNVDIGYGEVDLDNLP